jgi:hypothetical protein
VFSLQATEEEVAAAERRIQEQAEAAKAAKAQLAMAQLVRIYYTHYTHTRQHKHTLDGRLPLSIELDVYSHPTLLPPPATFLPIWFHPSTAAPVSVCPPLIYATAAAI